jgi:hypothetical protein
MKQKQKKAKLLKRLARGNADDAVKSSPSGRMSNSLTFADSIAGLTDEQRSIFAPDLEEITDALANELVESGKCDRETSLKFRRMGLKYNRARNSFMTEPEGFGGFADDDDDDDFFDDEPCDLKAGDACPCCGKVLYEKVMTAEELIEFHRQSEQREIES